MPTPHARCSLLPCRDFIEKRFVELKKANPDLPILIRECSDVQPKLWARYGERETQGTRDPGEGNKGSKRERAAQGHRNLYRDWDSAFSFAVDLVANKEIYICRVRVFVSK